MNVTQITAPLNNDKAIKGSAPLITRNMTKRLAVPFERHWKLNEFLQTPSIIGSQDRNTDAST
ncbi:hypothetical protein E2C01_069867 [Portunus trituberculatus]|uniref:Uncharacterized protein n=1 Tax=Portunus trituberculatus TaxID=210409 RepID=A0A5B7I0P3_PORTR|nr:hypothetical protein [Portunus trituberculatus]